jgi:hypothetical protein
MGGGNTTVAMAIGGNVTGGTLNSILYLGTNGILSQDNTNFGWLDSPTYFHVGPALNLTNYVNTWASFVGASNTSNYGQVIIQDTNPNGQGGLVVGGDDMTNTSHYGQFYKNGSANATLRGTTNIYFANADAFSIYTTDNEFDIGALGVSGIINFFAGGYATPSQTISSTMVTDVALTVSGVANIGSWGTLPAGGIPTNATSSNTAATANAVGVNGITGLGTGVATALAVATNSIRSFVTNIASGTFSIPTSVIGVNSVVTWTASNASIVAGDQCDWEMGGNYGANVGFTPPNQLSMYSFSGSGNCDWFVGNNTGSNITPDSGLTIRWWVRR